MGRLKLENKAYKIEISLYVPPKYSKDPLLVHVKGFDLVVDGKDIREIMEVAGGVIATYIEVAEERNIGIWDRIEYLSDEEYEREWDLIDEEETEYWQKKSKEGDDDN